MECKRNIRMQKADYDKKLESETLYVVIKYIKQ